MNPLLYGAHLLILAFTPIWLLAQTANNGAPANFGIEGDLYAESLPMSTADWFPAPNGQNGVIEAFGATTIIDELERASSAHARNHTFVRRMIPATPGMLDAVYIRDEISAQSARDRSTFITGASKNADHPDTWEIGSPGSPQGDDLVDVMAHLRRTGPSLTEDLWFMGGAATRSPNGNGHIDFEFYRQDLSLNDQAFSSSGSEGGRTSWVFDSDGKVISSGDLIFSVDYLTGGSEIEHSIRLWVDENQLPGGSFSGFNSLPSKPFRFTGIFNAGTNSGNFGYAEIEIGPGMQTQIYVAVNNTRTAAPPWGTLSGPRGSLTMEYEPMQWLEVALNLSAFGLDASQQINTSCGPLLGTILVKTRASQSFTAQLKDFAIPQPFGNSPELSLTVSAPGITCENPAVNPIIDVNLSGLEYKWEGPAGFLSNDESPLLTQGGTYIVSAGPPNGCYLKDTFFVETDTVRPIISTGGGGTLTCTQTEVLLSGSSSTTGTDLWWEGPGNQVHLGSQWSVGQTGVYHFFAADPSNGCIDSVAAEVLEDTSVPVVSVREDTLDCFHPTTSLHASVIPGGTFQYNWQGPSGFSSTSASPVVSVAGAYTLTLTVPENGCTVVAQTLISKDLEVPTVQMVGDTLSCQDTSARITGIIEPQSEVSISWTGPSGFISQEAFPEVNMPGTYSVSVQNLLNGCSARASVDIIEHNALSDFNLTATGMFNCLQNTVGLSTGLSGSGYTISWQGPHGFSSNQLDPSVTEAGTYTVQVRHDASGCEITDSIEVLSNRNVPEATLSGNVNINCFHPQVQADLALLSAGTYTFSWSGPNGFVSGRQQPLLTEGGNYQVRITDSESGCDTTLMVEVIGDFAPPLVQITGEDLTCLDSIATLRVQVSGTTDYTVIWVGPNGFSSRDSILEVEVPGLYKAYVRNPENGCLTMVQYRVDDRSQPVSVSAEGGSITCVVSEVTLSYSISPAGNYSISWSGPNGFSSTDPQPVVNEPGIYRLVVENLITGCKGEAAATVDIDQTPPQITLRKSSDLDCNHTSVIVFPQLAAGSYSYNWTGPGGSLGTARFIRVTEPGRYTVSVTDLNTGCTSQKTISVEANFQVPDGSVAVADTLSCLQPSVQLQSQIHSGSTVSYLWSGPGGFRSSLSNPSVGIAGTYTLQLTDLNSGCDTLLTVEVTGDPTPPTVSATGGILDCNNPEIMLGVESGSNHSVTIMWTGPNGFASREEAPVVAVAGTYRVILTEDLTGCTATAYATVIDRTQPPYLNLYARPLGCEGTETQITAQISRGIYGWHWTGSNGFTSTQPAPYVNETGTYHLTVNNSETGCTTSSSITITRDEILPQFTLDNRLILNCFQTSGRLSVQASGAYSYLWTGPNGFRSTASAPLVTQPGTYSLEVTHPTSACVAYDSVLVQADFAAPEIHVSDEELNCEVSGIFVQVQTHGSGPFTYSWQGPDGFSSTDASIYATIAGTYSVVVVDTDNGCTNEARGEVLPAPPCSDAACTQTQGFYGNAGGRFCDGTPTPDLVSLLLANPLVLGGGSNRFELTGSDIDCLFQRMPGGGNSLPLQGMATCSDPVGIPLDNRGQFSNNLLAQTLTLGLNLRLSPQLRSVELAGTRMITRASSACQDSEATPIPGTEQSFRLPASVLQYLTNPTVASLYDLANEALAGSYHPADGRPALSDITAALSSINEGFDGCRILKGFEGAIQEQALVSWEVNASPNPSLDQPVQFAFEAMFSGQARMRLVEPISGRVMGTLFEGDIIAGQTYSTIFSAEHLPAGSYFYRLEVNGAAVAFGSIKILQ